MVNFIMECVSTVEYQVRFNAKETKSLKPMRAGGQSFISLSSSILCGCVGVKTGRPWGRESRAVDLGSVVGTGETMFTQVRVRLMEVIPYVLLLFIVMEMYQVQS